MRQKRKNCERVDFILPDSLLQCFKEKYLAKYLENILHAPEGVHQINILKEILSNVLLNELKADELELVCDALCQLFYQAPLKSSHRKTLNRIIQEISEKHPGFIEISFEKSLEMVINSTIQNASLDEIETSMQFIISLIDNLKLGKKVVDQNLSQVCQYISSAFKVVIESLKIESNLQRKSDLYCVCQTILKLVTHSIQNSDNLKNFLKCNDDEKFQDYLKDLKISIEYLLIEEETNLNCRLNAAFAFCHYYYYAYGVKKLKNDLFSENSEQFVFPCSSQLCISSGIMGVLPLEDFIENYDDSVIAKKILHQSISISKIADDSEVLLLCARNILQWSNVLLNALRKDVTIEKEQRIIISYLFSKDDIAMNMLFEYVLYNREHFIDTLRHLSRDIFRSILNLHMLSINVEPSKSTWIKEMAIFLLNDLPIHSRGKYGMLCCIVEIIGTETVLTWYPSLPDELYSALIECSLVSHVSEFCQVLFCCSLESEDDKHFHMVWLKPLLEVLCRGSKEQTNAISEHILPKLLKVKQSSLSFLLLELSTMWENNIGNSFSSLVTCMKLYQRQNGSLNYSQFISNDSLLKAFSHADDQVRLSAFALLCESFKTTEPIDLESLEIIKCGLPYNINCQSPSFRQQLISYMKKLFLRISESGYTLMKNQQCGTENNPSCISKIPEIYQDFVLWLKKYLFSCLHPGANFPRRVTSLNLLYLLHELFSDWLLIVDSDVTGQTLLYVLQDTYDNNKSLALKILTSHRSLSWCLEDEKLFQTALTLASSTKPPDTATSAYVFAFLIQCPSFQNVVQKCLSGTEDDFLNISLSIPPKLSHSCQFHTILLLMCELNKQLELAKKSVLLAAAHAPLYGILICIRSVLCSVKFGDTDGLSINLWQSLIKELIIRSINVAYVVEPIVCNSSPEGHLPMDTDVDSISLLQAAVRRALGCRFQSAIVQEDSSVESDVVILDLIKTHAVTAQILLLCCWRTHKEVSLLLGDICEKVPLADADCTTLRGILDICKMKEIGKYFIHQMSLVKHKGAFEQAHIGFSKVCERLWRCNISELHELPKLWLKELILAIKGLKEDIQLCPTRRSAGLPFIVQGILTSEPSIASSSFFKKSMSDFLVLAEPSKTHCADVQIHALNILRALFRDACLGEAVMPFASDGFKIAIQGFKSHLWGVRNSSTLLFSALMTRVFGVNRSHDEAGKKNRLTGKSFFSYYRDLYQFLYNELEECVSSLHQSKGNKISIQPSLYPTLLLLGRLYPAPGEKDTHLSSFIPFLNLCLSSPVWKTRSLAAKASIAFTSKENIPFTLQSIIYSLPSDQSNFYQNRVHGHLLQILNLLGEFNLLSDSQKISIRSILQLWFNSSFDFYIRCNKCPSTKAAYLEIVFYAMLLDIQLDVTLINILLEDVWLESETELSYPDKDSYLSISVTTLLLQTSQLNRCHLSQPLNPKTGSHIMLDELLVYFITCSNKIARSSAIEILLWFLHKDEKIYKHCFDSSDDIVILQKIMKILNLMDKTKFCFEVILNESNACHYLVYLVDLLGRENDSPFMRQIYNLLNFLPISVSIPWTFLQKTYSWDLLDKLNYVLDQMEVCNRDEVECQMLLFSTHIFVNLCQEFEKSCQNKFLYEENGFDVIKKWLLKVEDIAYPESSLLLRLTVVSVLHILVDTSIFPRSKLFGTYDSNLWQALLLVLIDDEPEIKNLASEIVLKIKLSKEGHKVLLVVPSKALDLMVETFVEIKFNNPVECISMLINWMLSSNTTSLDSTTDEQPFDKGEMNVFSEDLSLTLIVSRHLTTFLRSINTFKVNTILFYKISNWKDKSNESLTFDQFISLCLAETNSTMDKILKRTPVSPMLDVEQELLQISQKLSVVLELLPWTSLQTDLKILGNELFRKFHRLDFKTIFIEGMISKIQQLLDRFE